MPEDDSYSLVYVMTTLPVYLSEYYPTANCSSKTVMQKNNSSNSDTISKDVVKSLLFKGSGLYKHATRRSKDALQHAKYIH